MTYEDGTAPYLYRAQQLLPRVFRANATLPHAAIGQHFRSCKHSHRHPHHRRLHALQRRWLLEVAVLHLLAGVVGAGLAVKREQVAEVELGLLEQLDLADVNLLYRVSLRDLALKSSIICTTYVLERVDALGALLNLTANHLRNQLRSQLRQRARRRLPLHDVRHLLPDRADLRAARIRRLLDLVRPPLGEGNAEQAEQIVVGSLDHNVGLDERLPLADERAQLVGGEVQAVEVGQAVLALDLIDPQLDLAEGMVLVLLKIGERDLEDAALEGVVGVLETGGAVHERLADTAGEGIVSPDYPRLFLSLYGS